MICPLCNKEIEGEGFFVCQDCLNQIDPALVERYEHKFAALIKAQLKTDKFPSHRKAAAWFKHEEAKTTLETMCALCPNHDCDQEFETAYACIMGALDECVKQFCLEHTMHHVGSYPKSEQNVRVARVNHTCCLCGATSYKGSPCGEAHGIATPVDARPEDLFFCEACLRSGKFKMDHPDKPFLNKKFLRRQDKVNPTATVK